MSFTALALILAAYPSVELKGFTHVKQRPDFCGEADVEMAMKRLGHTVTQDQVFALANVDPALGRGAVTNELATALRALGVEPGRVWYHGDAETQWKALHADLLKGDPSIVCMHYSDEPKTTEHFRLVTGYDAATDEVVYQEPAEDDGGNRRMKRDLFLKLWSFRPAKDRTTLIRFQLPPPKQAPVLAVEVAPTKADASQHVQAMKDKAGLTLVWEKPFLVVGNEGREKVKDRATKLVAWTRDLLVKDFFVEAPRTLQEVWILGDKASYEKVSRGVFKTEPSTPYGYYLSSRQALVMNIGPGYGTLTHELVHPFMHHAWEDTPAWLNEGVASLFERPAEKDGHLVGKVNWRLPGLLDGLKAGKVPSFKTLVHLSADDFYEDAAGVNYAAARYLCYWLQEKGLLSKFVRRSIALKDSWKALGEVLGKDPDSFRPEWETFVKGLSTRA